MMKNKLTINVAALLFIFVLFVNEGLCDSVQIRGNQRIDTKAIQAQLPKETGSYSSDEISKAIKSIYGTGFFDKVQAVREGDSLVFQVLEKPLVRKVYIEGNKEIDSDDLLPVLTLGANRFLDKYRVDTLRKNTVAFYQTKGFYDASATATVVPVGDNQVDVTFKVEEGERFKLREIKFNGINDLDESELKKAMQVKEYSWWKSWLLGTGRVSKELLEVDQAAIRQVMLDKGHVEGTIGDGIVEREDDGLVLKFDVHEGPVFQIGNISASGDLINNKIAETIDGVKLTEGETFSASQLRADAFVVTEKFTDEGYAFANVVPNTNIRSEDKKVDIIYEVSKGKPVSIERINITGNKKTYDNVIRREMEIQEQDKFSSSKVKRSKELLQRLGFFNDVTIAPEAVKGTDDKVNLNVGVQEGNTGSFSAGAGFSSADGVIFNTRVTENNLFGTGRSVDLNVDIGSQITNFSASYRDRRFMDSYLSTGIEAYRNGRYFDDFNRAMTGGGFSLGYPLEQVFGESMQDINSTLRYDIANVEITNVDDSAAPLIKDSIGGGTASSLTPSLTRNTINNPLNPTEGSNQVLSFEVAGLGGDYNYQLLTARNTVYYPLLQWTGGALVFSNRTRYDEGFAPDKYGEGPDFFPLYKRFFPGGINSVRGYEVRNMGPRVGNSEYGGDKQFVNNTEIIFPLIESAGIRGVTFFDIGDAFDDTQNIDFSALRKAYGAGIRWQSPMGPIRIEFGFPMDKREGDSGMQTLFTFGAPF